MKAGKNDESNGTTVYIENSLEINRDIRKKGKLLIGKLRYDDL